ncbi:pyridine nucleotide-disulfide oxidoreductase [Mycolicibacterium arabiense]|uniref:Pyridine nucleotide-disulfide oxidoreductase n=1 Tax=Mycolicibacterium arabiense TaxID=1286181 RepID=A0A7I7RW16_9MYCO|nr:FAD-dependent oxidoreductase [Mycolicibacterium arabiense]BBY48828.1 pyridine nucleotide-disulfide oxidoreductase [Mycolicibacterium arabiense]
MTIDADLVVIGFGKGGKTLAATLGKQGKRVVMIERSAAMYGGTCINIGCVPTKSMVFQAEEVSVHPPEPSVYTNAIRATADLTSGMRGENFAMLDTIPSVDVLTGTASFVDPHTVTVDTADGIVTVIGRTIVIGTGSEPTWPDVPGLRDNPRAVTSTDLLSTEDLPARLVVLGGGYVGLEFAAMYAAYGAEVTVLERHDAVLTREDDDIASCATELLAEAGVHVVTSAQVTAVDGGTVHYEVGGAPTSVDADLILVALGRHPVTADLGLANAGVATRPDGSIEVDEHLRTNVAHVFAVGDVNGGPQFTYVSLDDYRIVADQLTGAGSRSTTDRRAVPFSLFMTPPLSRVGLTEREAKAAGHRVKVAALPVAKMATVPRARIVHQAKGMMKAVVDADTDEILGAALLSYDSHEVINTVALAMRHGITASTLRDEIYTHPSMTEAFNQLLGALA